MIIDMHIDIEKDIVSVREELDCGTKKKKTLALEEFLQTYTSFIKEKEDNYDFLYLPAGTLEYRKNLNTCTFVVQTNPYKEFYGLANREDDYLLVMKTNVNGTVLLGFEVFATKGAFNRILSSFTKVYENKKSFAIADESDGAKKCFEFIDSFADKPISTKLKYKDII